MSPNKIDPRFRTVVVVLSALLLFWPALLNGGVFFSSDSIAYIRGPDQAVMKLLGPGAGTAWSAKPMGFQQMDAAASPGGAEHSPPLAGRSIYYGVLANLGARTGGFWLTIGLQALAAAFAIDLCCRAVGWTRFRTFALSVAAAAVLTPLAFYVDCIMPDVWAAIAVLVAAAIAAGGERLNRLDRLLGFMMLAYAGAAHTSLLAVLAAIAAAALAMMILRRGLKMKLGAPGLLAGLTTAALIAAVLAGLAFNLAVKKVYGEPPLQPPFLTARIVGDGHAGEAWLKAHCPQAGFEACRIVGRLPMSTDDFLWSTDPAHSAFWTATPSERKVLGAEQMRLVMDVVEAQPIQVAEQFAMDGVTQLGTLSLEDFNHKANVRQSIAGWMVEPQGEHWRSSMAYRQAWPVNIMNLGLVALVIASMVGICALAVKSMWDDPAAVSDAESRVLIAAFVVITAVVANAFVCGGLSGVFGRYESRIVAPLILTGLSTWVLILSRRPQASSRGYSRWRLKTVDVTS